MIVDIQPQWEKLSKWWWNGADGRGISIYEMLEHDYSAFKISPGRAGPKHIMIDFPSESAYSMFLLRFA